jgi:phage tail sheath gpL-like
LRNAGCCLCPRPIREASGAAPSALPAQGAKDGSIDISINGVIVSAGDDADAISAALVAAINGDISLPVEAEGVSVSAGDITHGTGGDNSFDMSQFFASVADTRFNYIVSAFDAPAQIKEMADELASRFDAMRQIWGHAFIALSGELGDKSTAGTMLYKSSDINSPHLVLIPRGSSSILLCEWAGGGGGGNANYDYIGYKKMKNQRRYQRGIRPQVDDVLFILKAKVESA